MAMLKMERNPGQKKKNAEPETLKPMATKKIYN